MSRVIKRRFYGEAMQTPIHVLLTGLDRENAQLDAIGWNGRRVLGYKLPDWQRPGVWSEAQSISFIESVYLGANIGQFMLNVTLDPTFDRVLLDGQQRLSAIERYVKDEFAVPGEDGEALVWSELNDREKAHFYRVGFPWLCTSYQDEALLRQAYNIHNFSGTAHTPDQMAELGDLKEQRPHPYFR